MASAVRAGRQITHAELESARQTVRLCSGLSRLELARTICEHWDWVTASGSHKVTACLKVLEEWEQQGLLRLPGMRGYHYLMRLGHALNILAHYSHALANHVRADCCWRPSSGQKPGSAGSCVSVGFWR